MHSPVSEVFMSETPDTNTAAGIRGTVPTLREQVAAYEAGSKVYDQIIEIHGNIVGVANVYLVVTGVLWGAVATNAMQVPTTAATAILAFHLLGSIAVLQSLAASLNAISLRHAFLPQFGEKCYPEIEAIGKLSFEQVYGSRDSFKAKFAGWGHQRLLWYLIPGAGFFGSAFFIVWLSS